jgi:serine/threonine protein kinase
MQANDSKYLGKQVGSYRIVSCLGRGGFADVYLGEHIYLKTQSAIKMLHVQLSKRAIQNFLKEATIIAQLEHPNIIRVFDYGVQDGSPFLVMNYAPNGTLRQRYPRSTSLSLEKIIPYIQQAASALDYAHRLQLIHRDVKPANMLIGQQQQLLLSDFGLALAVSNSDSQQEINTTAPSLDADAQLVSMISAGSFSSGSQLEVSTAGTIRYMAPEQIQGKACYASDQYALGIIAYEWLCGECPFAGSFMKIASQHVLMPPPSLCAKVPNLPLEAEQVIFKALAKEPTQRFASVSDFAQALQQVSQQAVPVNISIQKNTSAQFRIGTTPPNSFKALDIQSQQTLRPGQDISDRSSANDIPSNLQLVDDSSKSVNISMPAFQTSAPAFEADDTYSTFKLPPEADITYNTSRLPSFSGRIFDTHDSADSQIFDTHDSASSSSDISIIPIPQANIDTDAEAVPDLHDTSKSISTPNILLDTRGDAAIPPTFNTVKDSTQAVRRKLRIAILSVAVITCLIGTAGLGILWYKSTHTNPLKASYHTPSISTLKNTQQANQSTHQSIPLGTAATATSTATSTTNGIQAHSTITNIGHTNNSTPVSLTPGATTQPQTRSTPTPAPIAVADCIQGSPSEIHFTSRFNPLVPRSSELSLTNCGGTGSQNWQASVQSSGWLSLSADNGSIAPGDSTTIQVKTNIDGMRIGNYSGTIYFTAGSASFTVNVTYTITLLP